MSAAALARSSPARMTAVVVPSPHSWSWAFATSTIIFAAGCSTSTFLRIVTPSFEVVTYPIESTSNLSMPRGPSVERTASAIARAAAMLFFRAPRPSSRVVPSLRMKIFGPAPVDIAISVAPPIVDFDCAPRHGWEGVYEFARPRGGRNQRYDTREVPGGCISRRVTTGAEPKPVNPRRQVRDAG